VPLASSTLSQPLLCFVSAAPILGQCGHAYIASGGDPGWEAARVTMVLAAEISAQEVAMVWDSTALRVKDAED
jgi:hypothetical protein